MSPIDASKHNTENRRIRRLLFLSLEVRPLFEDGKPNGKPIGRIISETFRPPNGEPDVHNMNISSDIELRFEIRDIEFRGLGLSDYVTLLFKNGEEEGWCIFDDPTIVGSYLFYQYNTPINRFTAWVNENGLTMAEWLYGLVYFSNVFIPSYEQRNGGRTREEVERAEKRKREDDLKKTLRYN